jgi:ABC-type multidrug transport system ATPase subunit
MNAVPAKPLLLVRGLSFSFPSRHVFTDWSAAVAPGVTWLQGRNGSGKSTLLRLLAGALPPLTGELLAAGVDAARQPLDYRRQVFWCGPGAPAFDHLTPEEFFAFLRGLYPTWQPAELQAAVAGLSLQPFCRQRLRALSTGTQRKVWLAAACAVGAPVVLLDEPLNALDAPSLAWLLSCLGAAHEGQQAWLVASHLRPVPEAVPCAQIVLEV